MMLGMLIYYYYSRKKYQGFIDKRAISVQYNLPKEKSLLRSCFVLDYGIDYKIISAAILELVHLGYIELVQESPKYIPVLYRKRKDISYLTDDQVYIMNILLFHDSDVYKMYLPSDEKGGEIQKSFFDLEKILKKWTIDEKYIIGDINQIRDNFAIKTRLLLFIFLLPNFFILGANLVLSLLVLTFAMFIIVVTFTSFKKNILEVIYYTILFFALFTLGIKKLFLKIDISIFLDSSFYPMYAWQFTAILGIYIMWSLSNLGQQGAYLKKHILGYDLFRRVVTKNSQEEYDEEKLYALHYNVNTMSANALSKYIYSVLITNKTPKKTIVKK